jgi:hypothetical protein
MMKRVFAIILAALMLAGLAYAVAAVAQPVLADETKANPKPTRVPARPDGELTLVRQA